MPLRVPTHEPTPFAKENGSTCLVPNPRLSSEIRLSVPDTCPECGAYGLEFQSSVYATFLICPVCPYRTEQIEFIDPRAWHWLTDLDEAA